MTPIVLNSKSIALLVFWTSTFVVAQDCAIANAIWNKMKGNTWVMDPSTCCSSNYGVTCTSGKITKIAWASPYVSGVIPPDFANFTSLATLSLTGTGIIGAIPSAIGSMTTLTSLTLSGTKLNGTIPTTFGNLVNLLTLDLSNNQLSGPIPSVIGNAVGLTSLNLATNSFNGTIPATIGNLVNIKTLTLNNLKISGPLPSTLGNLVNMTSMNIAVNAISPPLPISLITLPNIQTVYMDTNTQLSSKQCSLRVVDPQPDCPLIISIYRALGGSAAIPADGATNCCGWNNVDCSAFEQEACWDGNTATNLRFRRIWQTWRVTGINWEHQNLRGSIAPSMANLAYLKYLILRDNYITGEIPSNLGNMPSLQTIDLSSNKLSGALSSWIGSLTKLTRFSVTNNLISGGLPSELGNLNSLISLELGQNQFTGLIPSSFQNLASLLNLELNDNLLTGSIPTQLGNLKSLLTLSLSNNLLSGFIPSSFGAYENLTYLSLASNKFVGGIPSEFGNLVDLQFLYLQGNYLNSTIPTSFGNLNQLVQLFLSNNFLSGTVPSEIGSLNLLLALRLDNNNFTGVPSSLSSLTKAKTVLLPNPMTLVPYDLVSRNPSFTLLDTDWASYMNVNPLNKRQASSTQGTLTADQLFALCPLNNVQSADVPAGCVAGLYNKYCLSSNISTPTGQALCHSIYDQVFAVSIFSSIGTVCPAWKYGPRSAQCAQAIKTFSYQLPYILVTSDMAANLTANILGSQKYAPCYSTPGNPCYW